MVDLSFFSKTEMENQKSRTILFTVSDLSNICCIKIRECQDVPVVQVLVPRPSIPQTTPLRNIKYLPVEKRHKSVPFSLFCRESPESIPVIRVITPDTGVLH